MATKVNHLDGSDMPELPPKDSAETLKTVKALGTSISSLGGSYGLSIHALSTYMPTGTIAAFVVLTQLVSDGGQCKHTTDSQGNFVKANDHYEVAFMALVIGLLGIACFISAFLKTRVGRNADGSPGLVTYRFVSTREFQGKDENGQYKAYSDLMWFEGWKLWIHAVFSTLAYVTWSLTSTAATSCFYTLPATVSRSLSPIVAVICSLAFAVLGPPDPTDSPPFEMPDLSRQAGKAKPIIRDIEKFSNGFKTSDPTTESNGRVVHYPGGWGDV